MEINAASQIDDETFEDLDIPDFDSDEEPNDEEASDEAKLILSLVLTEQQKERHA